MSTVMRLRKSARAYAIHRRKTPSGVCEFCAFNLGREVVIKGSEHFWIVRNLFPYDMWDSSGIEEHLMLVPKRHISSLSELKSAEQLDFLKQLTAYEKNNYSIYARAPDNRIKTIVHQHTHLIKITSRKKRIIFFLKKPHILLMR